MSRETAMTSPSPAINTRSNTSDYYASPQPVQAAVARKGPCEYQPPAKPVRQFGAPEGRTSCPPFQHEHLMEPDAYGNMNFRCISPSSETLHKAQIVSMCKSNFKILPELVFKAR